MKHDIDKCALAQTLLFVAANKVCTAQYFLLVAASPDRRRRRLEHYVETLEELGVELRALVACCLWFGVPRFTCAYSFVGLLPLILPGERLALDKRRVGAAGGEGASQVRVANLVVEETDAWTDDGDTDEDVDDEDPGAASGFSLVRK